MRPTFGLNNWLTCLFDIYFDIRYTSLEFGIDCQYIIRRSGNTRLSPYWAIGEYVSTLCSESETKGLFTLSNRESGNWSMLGMNGAPFLGGLSLHLNHLIASCMGISYRQFRTLPIGIFLSNLDSRQLDTSLMISYGHFWHMSTFGDSRVVWVLLPKYRALRKSKFSWWRSDQWWMRLGVLGGADN